MTFKRTTIVFLIMAATWGVTLWAGQVKEIRPEVSLDRFPAHMGPWQGTRGKLDANVHNILGVEDYVLAHYRRPGNQAVSLYIGFYASQRQGDIIHSPKNCLPGAGWRITRTGTETLTHPETRNPVKVATLFLEKGPEKQVVLYWFQSRGRIISSEYWQKVWLVWDALTRHRTDGSFIRLISPVVRNEAQTLDTLKDFAQHLQPQLDRFIPS